MPGPDSGVCGGQGERSDPHTRSSSATRTGYAAGLSPAVPVGITAPPPTLLIGRRGADLPEMQPCRPHHLHWPAGSRSQHPRRPNFIGLRGAAPVGITAPPPALLIGRRGADLPRDATLSAPSPSLAGREPISAPPQTQLHWPAGSRSCWDYRTPAGPPHWSTGSRPTPRCNPVGPTHLHWPVGSRSQHPRRPNFIGLRGADLPQGHRRARTAPPARTPRHLITAPRR